MSGIELEITLNGAFVDIQGTEVAEALKTAGLNVDTVWVDGLLYFQKPAPLKTPDELALDRDDFLASVIVTAVEGGIGYWASTSEYRWFQPDLDGGTATPTERGGANAFARLMDREGDGTFYDLTPAVIERAFETIEKGPVAYLSASRSKRLLGALDDLEGGDIDSSDADVLVQIGLLGGVVYG